MTITREWLEKTIAEFENTRDDIPFGLDDDDAKILKVLKQVLASMDAEPVAWQFNWHNEGWRQCKNKREYDEIVRNGNPNFEVRELYATPPAPVTGVYDDVLNIIDLLENNKWTEHCTNTVLGSLLESEITRLVGMTQSAPIMSLPDDWQVVPKKPNSPMLTAGYQAYVKGQHRGRFYRSYQAMLEAAPKLSEVNK
ncbi:TPA: hypothetical protein OQ574_003953 [Salmonella enterica]|nr:hypothetical protein [Salmonella enterica]